MAEIEIGIMGRQALARPLPDLESFKEQIRIWTIKRNSECRKICDALECQPGDIIENVSAAISPLTICSKCQQLPTSKYNTYSHVQ